MRDLFEDALAHADSGYVLVMSFLKPQSMPGLLSTLSQTLQADPLIISIAAGIPLSMYSRNLGNHHRLIRVMPKSRQFTWG